MSENLFRWMNTQGKAYLDVALLSLVRMTDELWTLTQIPKPIELYESFRYNGVHHCSEVPLCVMSLWPLIAEGNKLYSFKLPTSKLSWAHKSKLLV